MTNKQIIRQLILNEVERMEPNVQSFEDNPIAFILNKYPTLTQTLELLMTPAFKDYVTGIYIVAPKPTTFKIVLHNDQDFLLTFLEKAYEATVAGEKERAINAIARLLTLGNPISTKGDEGEEQTSDTGTEEPQAAAETAPPEEAAAAETES
jgi:hypothetical protein